MFIPHLFVRNSYTNYVFHVNLGYNYFPSSFVVSFYQRHVCLVKGVKVWRAKLCFICFFRRKCLIQKLWVKWHYNLWTFAKLSGQLYFSRLSYKFISLTYCRHTFSNYVQLFNNEGIHWLLYLLKQSWVCSVFSIRYLAYVG